MRLTTEHLVMLTVACLLGSASVHCQQTSGDSMPQLTTQDYARAERFLEWNIGKYVSNGDVRYEWIGQEDRFWYSKQTHEGKQFVTVDAATGTRSAAFDHADIARALTEATGKEIDAGNLPFERFEFAGDGRDIDVDLDSKRWRCRAASGCQEIDRSARSGALVSPNQQWAVYSDGPNLRLRSLQDRSEKPLTDDGVERLAYGVMAGSSQSLWDVRFGRREPRPPVALWSPDSTQLLVELLDEREVLDLPYVQNVPGNGEVRPRLRSFPMAFPGDVVRPTVRFIVFNIVTGEHKAMNAEPLVVLGPTPIHSGQVWWSTDSKKFFAVALEEGRQRERLLEVDAATGATRELLVESSATYVNTAVDNIERGGTGGSTLSNGEFLWPSERSDWAHLYLYDRDGTLLRPITAGAWRVREIVRVDERKRMVYFTAGGGIEGRDPYQRYMYSARLDGSKAQLLTPDDGDHEITRRSFAASGKYFVSTYSRPDLPPRTELRTREGRLVSLLEQADISALQAGGFRMPEPFSVLAADGKTRIYGTLFRPSRFDPARKYPVVEIIYPGPQAIMTKKTFIDAVFPRDRPLSGQALAELGFILVTIDGRGGPFRSKSFHDLSYRRMQAAGELEDHIGGIRQLARLYPYMDLDRVGIHGTSSGGYGTVRAMLDYPDFYKVGVAANGDQDKRSGTLSWGPTYQGPYPSAAWDALSNVSVERASHLKGKLLLAVGDMDDNVHPAQALQLADALIKANRDFDLLIIPNGRHEIDTTSRYFIRRRWDYFVRYLLGAEPPVNYEIQ